MDNPWNWDPIRQAYVYADGSHVHLGQGHLAQTASNTLMPQQEPRTISTEDYGLLQEGKSHTHGLTASVDAMTIGQGPYDTPSYSVMQPSSYGFQTPMPQRDSTSSHQQTKSSQGSDLLDAVETRPNPLVREPRGEITLESLTPGKRGDEKRLDPTFQKQKHAANFFKRGKVFKMLWPEVAVKAGGRTTHSTDGIFVEPIFCEIRRFVVIKEGHQFCVCLPILTYGRRGVAKPTVVKWQHAIIWTGSRLGEPQPHPDEIPMDGKDGMMASIRVVPNSKSGKLDPMSRINFAKMYTVEHNVNVMDFGDVHEGSIAVLQHQWQYVLARDLGGSGKFEAKPSATASNEPEAEDGGNNSEVDEVEVARIQDGNQGETTGFKQVSTSQYLKRERTSPQMSSGLTNVPKPAIITKGSPVIEPGLEGSVRPSRLDGSVQLRKSTNAQARTGSQSHETSTIVPAGPSTLFLERETRRSPLVTEATANLPQGSSLQRLLKEASDARTFADLDEYTLSVGSVHSEKKSQFHDSGVDVQTVRSGMTGGMSQFLSEPDRDRTFLWTDEFGIGPKPAPHDVVPHNDPTTSLSDESADDDDSTVVTEPEVGSSSSDDDSDSENEVRLSPELPPDIQPDERLVDPEKWLNRLQRMECDIFETSSLASWLAASTSGQFLEPEASRQLLQSALSNIEKMEDAKYCQGSINVIVTDPERSAVASLVCIPKAEVVRALQSLADVNAENLMELLVGWGLKEVHQSICILEEDKRSLAVATVISRFISFAVVSFAGAHLECFEEKYDLKLNNGEISFGFGLICRRRSLKCLDVYFHGRQTWVFEQSVISSVARRHDALYLSTTIEEFSRIWGPVWVTAQKTVTSTSQPRIMAFNIGLGFIVPWDPDPCEPEARGDEIFSHYTDDRSCLDFSLFDPVKDTLSALRLLIGARSKLSRNKRCVMTNDSCTQMFRNQNALSHPGTSRRRKTREVQTVTLSLSALGIVNTGYQEEYKIREGSSFRDCVISSWVNSPLERNPAIVLKKIGIEVSGCTENARRRRLRHILSSETIKTYLCGISLDWDEECKQQYFAALEDHDKHAFVKQYHEKKVWRSKWSEAVCASLKVLKDTGPGESERLAALWCPNSCETYLVKLPHRRWVGLVKDTITSCALATLTKDCLGFKKDFYWAGDCASGSDHAIHSTSQRQSVLETALLINETCSIPKGLTQTEGCWEVTRLVYEDLFDLGDSGCLKVVSGFRYSRESARGLVLRWTTPNMGRETLEKLRERFLKKNRNPCHSEEIEYHKTERSPIVVHVTSYGG